MKDLLQERLDRYQTANESEQEYAIKEVTQEIVLYALYRQGFFEVAAFQGGTALRILYGLNRFSEDLDFALQRTGQAFDFETYLEGTKEILAGFGYSMEIQGKSKADQAMQARFLKEEAPGRIFRLQHRRDPRRAIRIKIEIDTRPPPGATFEIKYHDFPLDFALVAHDLPSLFAGKSHALLCRPFVKGRDWYDFTWYVGRHAILNATLLQEALKQLGPWEGKNIRVDMKWYAEALRKRIHGIDWTQPKQEIEPLLRSSERDQLKLWDERFFLDKLSKLLPYTHEQVNFIRNALRTLPSVQAQRAWIESWDGRGVGQSSARRLVIDSLSSGRRAKWRVDFGSYSFEISKADAAILKKELEREKILYDEQH